MKMSLISIFTAVIIVCTSCSAAGTEAKIEHFHGASDASAAVALGNDMFIMADDENNALRLYNINKTDGVAQSFELSDFLYTTSDHPEADIEGATLIGNRIYWITSHGRNKDGKIRTNRYRFFATDVEIENKRVKIKPPGRASRTLVHHMLNADSMRFLRLDKVTKFNVNLSKKDRKKLAPKEDGLNIEGLCASADGTKLYIGLRNPTFRNPKTNRKEAIVAVLLNADDVIEKNRKPIFTGPILWNLNGLGVRSMEYSAYHKTYFIIGGRANSDPGFILYKWSGDIASQPVRIHTFDPTTAFAPEVLMPVAGKPYLWLLSDDGTIPVKVDHPSQCMEDELLDDGRCPNKYLMDYNKKTFRMMVFHP